MKIAAISQTGAHFQESQELSAETKVFIGPLAVRAVMIRSIGQK
jgi:hypothetical protein